MNKKNFKKSILLSAALSITFLGSGPKFFLNIQPENFFPKAAFNPAVSASEMMYSAYLTNIYQTANLYASGLNADVFCKAVTGFYNLKNTSGVNKENSLLTIVDFSKPSTAKRMWIIDLDSAKLLLNTWVAHGQGSGDNMASHFSNIDSSHESSLGFYLTGEVYTGKHGRSLRLDGMDESFNSNARSRDIVIHAADYVSQQTIANIGRLGRSFGCPVVSPELAPMIIDMLKNKTVMFINGNDSNYRSKYLNHDFAANFLFPDSDNHLQHSENMAML